MAATLNPAGIPAGLAPALPKRTAHASIRRHLALSIGLGTALVVGVGGWATFTQISGAVIAPGQLVVESDVKKVQHPTGGVVGELRVRDGQRVKAGDILIRLDETQTRANLDIVLKALDEASARRSRDEAERDGAASVAFPPELLARAEGDPVVARLVDGETRLFNARVAGREGQKAQLRERVTQLRQEIAGLTEQAAAKNREIALIGPELRGVKELYAKNLVQLSRVNQLERDAARLEGERGQLMASTASARGKITEIELQILQIDQDMRTEVGKDLADIRAKWSELVEKRVSAEDQLKRIDLRAPQDGTVHQLTVHTIGGLVTPSEPAMLIVPSADQLAVEVRIQPQDIDSVHVDQKTVLRFPAFNQRVTPEIDGVVSRVSADVSTDPKTGATFYTARIHVPDSEKQRLGGVRLVPGMPVETFMQIGERSVLSYLTKPLTDQIAKAWRER
ncbi:MULTISPECIES: HlyD family type I secretion periplasmic adaptor subunit [Methylobacterium]|uniref:Membrane fusion protein (MFP) family protein n=3 Tax=Pseudomonadota TaxID=1224 RepID=A0ABQ4SVB8_9HYPH|nr:MULTISPECIES: HlyD family type I secretion periplasmic adaptor subunit [Methylobacterium]PIU05919.1 MAG: HlyD family type I secretion periplasmic adaptor subunit [Methylobacterium sp. CG09_land_8_20_14_0_10_71_15]PIU12713.1 MAG: HlyD family type I secretion periplasmic adaptor subunit [Methylobacterium sp. CG08_land_8_20_14_0_20_71_15]GBU18777.1 HlyD family type I secretion periplasmic adaptor subunit [Methylobacterium sp.]GJE05739.1 Type I secretion system membrane fusion protein PrsE [Meth